MPLTPREEQQVRDNLFPEAAAAVIPCQDFAWHRDQAGVATATMAQSSQALAIDVFGTFKSLTAPSRIVDALAAKWGLAFRGPWDFCIERKLAALDELKKSLLHQAFTGAL